MIRSERTAMRRKGREVHDADWIRDFLKKAPLVTIATDFEGQPFVHTMTHYFDTNRTAVYVHGARMGRFRENIEKNPRVALTATEMGRLVPGERAMSFSVFYASVVAFGRAVPVTDPEESRAALQGLLDKYFPDLKPDRDYRGITEKEMEVTAVHRIDIEEWSAKVHDENQ